jgi:ABC-type multidrug transport system fused ATPase/permease subunit
MVLFSKMLSLLTFPERRAAAVLVGLMFVGMLLEALGVGLVIPAIALMTQSNLAQDYPQLESVFHSFKHLTRAQLIQTAMIVLVVIYLLKNAFLAFLAWRQAKFTNAVQVQLSKRLFSLYMAQPYAFHLQRNSAQLIRNVSSEVGMFSDAIANASMVLAESLVLVGIASLLLVIEPLGTLLVVVVLGSAAWIFYRIIRQRILIWGGARQYHDGMRIQHLQQGLGGVKDAKLLGREEEFLKQYGQHTTESARANRLRVTVSQLPRLWLEWLAAVGLAALVLVMLAQGRDVESILPTVGLFAAAAFRLMPSVNRILSSMQTLRYNQPSITTLHNELKLLAENVDNLDSQEQRGGSLLSFQNELRADNVSYAYAGSASRAIDEVSLHIAAGESVGIVGPSGSGKSTLVDLLLGLLVPDSGGICVDSEDIHAHLRAWQDKIGYVPQSIYLTDDTLCRNIAFGLPDGQIDQRAVRKALAAAQLDEFVAGLPNGFSTIVGERGVRLSGGQRQRIGIARALYHDPQVLVLDEATSSLDTATERGVMRAVNALRGDKTVLIVAHRLSTVEKCNRIYRLEYGKVVAEGTPAEVLAIARAV